MTKAMFTVEERKQLLNLARNTLHAYLSSRDLPSIPADLPDSFNIHAGAFVSIHIQGNLRGCIGYFIGEDILPKTIQDLAISSGTRDPRFPEMTLQELEQAEFEISVLSPLKEISDPSIIEVGTHGIYITRGFYRGVLLPQVATEYGWDRETFLAHTCIKAGLPTNAWKQPGTKIEVFTAEVFSEHETE